MKLSVMRICVSITCLALLLSAMGCSDSTTVQDGDKTVVINKTPIINNEICTNGGVQIDIGIDTNGNGVLDDIEINETDYVCNGDNGEAGTDGESVLIRITSEPSGDNCATGGQNVESGIDANGNEVLDASEVVSTNYVCNGTNGADGADGQDGLNALVSISDEPAGPNCEFGGKKISAGLDVNQNDILDASEETTSSYICNAYSTEPPAVPENLQVTPGDETSAVLSWTHPGDNNYWTAFNIYRDGTKIATAGGLGWQDSGLALNTEYCYSVSAIDSNYNESAQTAPVCITTPVNVLISIDILPESITISGVTGGDAVFTANGNYNDGTVDITDTVNWFLEGPFNVSNGVVTVPPSTESVCVGVNAEINDIWGYATLCVEGPPPPPEAPVIDSIGLGEGAPGSVICDGSSISFSIYGSNFLDTSTVELTGGITPDSVVFQSEWQLDVTFSGLAAGAYDLTVSNGPGLTTTLLNALTVNEPPSILSVFPSTLYSNINNSVTVTTSGLADPPAGVELLLNGFPSLYPYLTTDPGDPNIISLITEQGTSGGDYTLRITDINGCTAESPVSITEIQEFISLASISPGEVSDSGATDITITRASGPFFDNDALVYLKDDQNGYPPSPSPAITVVSVTQDEIVATVPSGLPPYTIYRVIIINPSTGTGSISYGANTYIKVLPALPQGDNSVNPIPVSVGTASYDSTGFNDDYYLISQSPELPDPDMVFSYELPDGSTLTATVTPTSSWDPAIGLFTAPPFYNYESITYADNFIENVAETVSYTNTSGSTQTIYIVIDGGGLGWPLYGPFDLTINVL